jgi:hypothetical protein
MVQDYEIHWGKELELDKEQIFLIILKQGENFESIRPAQESQEKKIKNVEKLERFEPEFQAVNRRKNFGANNDRQSLVKGRRNGVIKISYGPIDKKRWGHRIVWLPDQMWIKYAAISKRFPRMHSKQKQAEFKPFSVIPTFRLSMSGFRSKRGFFHWGFRIFWTVHMFLNRRKRKLLYKVLELILMCVIYWYL